MLQVSIYGLLDDAVRVFLGSSVGGFIDRYDEWATLTDPENGPARLARVAAAEGRTDHA